MYDIPITARPHGHPAARHRGRGGEHVSSIGNKRQYPGWACPAAVKDHWGKGAQIVSLGLYPWLQSACGTPDLPNGPT